MPQGHGPEAPGLLGRYELVVEVAKGQLGPLWLAHVGAELFAIRRVQTVPPIERAEIDRLSEAAFWSLDVRHENVTTVLDVVMTEGELGVVTRYVPGEPLRSLLRLSSFKRKPVAPPIAMRIALDVLSGLGAAHEQAPPASGVNLGSGGVNPDTILLGGADGRALLLDVGISSVASSIPSLAQHPELGAYSAPEQLDDSKAADPRSDVFSLGVLLWEMISSRRLFAGSSQALIREKLEACAVPRLDANNPVGGEQISLAVADLVVRALARDPAERFESAGAMSEAILALGPDMIADHSAVAGLVEDLAGQAIATRSKALKRATMPQRAGPGPRPQLPTLVGIAPETPAPVGPAPAAAVEPAAPKPEAALALDAPEPEAAVALDAPKPEALPALEDSKPEASPAPADSKPEASPALADSKPEASPALADSKPEALPALEDSKPEASPAPADSKPEASPALADSKPEASPAPAAATPEADATPVEPKPKAEVAPADETLDVDVSVVVANDPPASEEPSTLRRASAPEDARAQARPDPSPISERALVDVLTRESNPGPPPLESIDFTSRGSDPKIAPPAETAPYLARLVSKPPPAAAPKASAGAEAVSELVKPPEPARAPMISESLFDAPPSQQQIARMHKARKVVAGVIAGLGLLLVVGLIASAVRSEDDSAAKPEATTAKKPDKPPPAPPAPEPAREPVEHAALPAPQAPHTGVDSPPESAEKAEPVEKTGPAEKTAPETKEKADSPPPRRRVAKSKSTVTKPRPPEKATEKPAAATTPRPAAKPKAKKPKYVPSGI